MHTTDKTEKMLSANKVCLYLDCSRTTLHRWYDWWENPKYEKPAGMVLPTYTRQYKGGPILFKMSDLPAFEKVKEQMKTTHYGCMAEYNSNIVWRRKSKYTGRRQHTWKGKPKNGK